MDASTAPLRVETIEGGAVRRLVLARPKGNVLDGAMVGALRDAFREVRSTPALKAVLLEADGPHFSFGASVEEHLPDRVAGMLSSLHGLFREMLDAAVTTVAAVRGACLGGGLELVSMCQRVVVAPDAKLGQPEISLGVFAPTASVVLPERIGRARAEDLCLTGRSVAAEEALRIGLVDDVAADPSAAALAWVRTHLLPRSAAGLRWAVRAVRASFAERFARDLAAVERMYVEGLMATRDAEEGLRAFLEKRAPRWSDA